MQYVRMKIFRLLMRGWPIASLALVALLGAHDAQAAGRVALVIGISQYEHVTPLNNPVRDAGLIAQTLRQVGFDVTEVTRREIEGKAALSAALTTFRAKAKGAEAAVIYYAGHGVEVEGQNYLLPVDVLASNADELKDHGILSSEAIGAVSGASRVNLVILDACRDNPFATRSLTQGTIGATRGLARETQMPANVAVLMATQPGLKASDGSGADNSPFAQALAQAISAEGLALAVLPSRLANLMSRSGIAQNPDMRGIIRDETWSFRPARGGGAPAIIAGGISADEFGLSLQVDAQGSVVVTRVSNGSPYSGILYPRDIIRKLNAGAVSDPRAVFGSLRELGRITLGVERNGSVSMKNLELPGPSED